jgi:hypothetical protein
LVCPWSIHLPQFGGIMKRVLALVLLTLIAGDLVVTSVALGSAVGREVNPLAVHAQHAWGGLWWLPKGSAGMMVVVLSYLWPSFRLFALAIGIYAWIVAANVFLLYFV